MPVLFVIVSPAVRLVNTTWIGPAIGDPDPLVFVTVMVADHNPVARLRTKPVCVTLARDETLITGLIVVVSIAMSLLRLTPAAAGYSGLIGDARRRRRTNIHSNRNRWISASAAQSIAPGTGQGAQRTTPGRPPNPCCRQASG